MTAAAPTHPAAPRRRSRRLLSRALTTAGVALIALYMLTFAVRNTPLQWDFGTYLMAAETARGGLDPYAPDDVAVIAGRPAPVPFLYPPVALLPFLALGTVGTALAAKIWMIAKLALLAGLIGTWHRLAPRAGLLAIALVAVFGWNGAALWDLRSGNVAIVEAAFLWAAFGAWIAGRQVAFAAFVVAAACFKLVPIGYLALLLVPVRGQSPAPRVALAAAAAFAAIVFLPLAVGPAAGWQGFLRHIPSAATLGDSNPSALGFLTVLVQSLGVGGAAGVTLGRVAWIVYALALVSLSLPVLQSAWRARDALRWVMIAVFLELLLAPRPMAYGFVRLVPAPFFFLPRPLDRPAGALVLALALSAQGLLRAVNVQPSSLAVTYAPFLLTLAVWLLVVRAETAPALRPAAAPARANP